MDRSYFLRDREGVDFQVRSGKRAEWSGVGGVSICNGTFPLPQAAHQPPQRVAHTGQTFGKTCNPAQLSNWLDLETHTGQFGKLSVKLALAEL